MLLYLLLNNEDKPSDPVGHAARGYSYSLMHRLNTNRHEVEPLLASMTHVCSAISPAVISDWSKKIQAMPASFYFGSHIVLYREFVNGGALMIAETTIYPIQAQYMGQVRTVRTILPMMYYARTNTETGVYEVRTLPPRVQNEFEAAGMFGQHFLEMIRQMPTPVNPQPQLVEEKKSWWKKIAGK